MFRNLCVVLGLVLLVGCSGNIPKSSDKIFEKTQPDKDGFSKVYFLETPLYLSRQGLTDPMPASIMFRALFDRHDNYQETQLYVTVLSSEWAFFVSAVGEDGDALKLNKLDGVVSSPAGIVSTEEIMTIDIPFDYLVKMSEKDWKIKLYGKRKSGVFVVPQVMSDGFLRKLMCYQSGECR